MAQIYARWIRDGKLYKGHPMTLEDVPPTWREAVWELLQEDTEAGD